MTAPTQYVDALLKGASYRGLRALLPALELTAQQRKRIQTLCEFAISIIDLDAEDWTQFPDVPQSLREVARAANVPQDPHAKDRGALADLVPTFAILQEVIAIRYRQGDLAGVLMVCHIMSEYLPMLAWQPHLGHAGDPPRLAEHVSRPGSLWGVDRDDPRSKQCEHSLSIRGSLREVVRVGRPSSQWSPEEYQRFWREYLDRDHSRVSGGLLTCGLISGEGRPKSVRSCGPKCTVWSELPGDKADLADRLALAGLFIESPLVAMRHSAPVGHGFGVPNVKELARAWEKTFSAFTAPWSGRKNPLQGARRAGAQSPTEPLPGLSAVVGAIAGRPVPPSAVFDEVNGLIREALT